MEITGKVTITLSLLEAKALRSMLGAMSQNDYTRFLEIHYGDQKRASEETTAICQIWQQLCTVFT
jgi:hypothetical protein